MGTYRKTRDDRFPPHSLRRRGEEKSHLCPLGGAKKGGGKVGRIGKQGKERKGERGKKNMRLKLRLSQITHGTKAGGGKKGKATLKGVTGGKGGKKGGGA